MLRQESFCILNSLLYLVYMCILNCFYVYFMYINVSGRFLLFNKLMIMMMVLRESYQRGATENTRHENGAQHHRKRKCERKCEIVLHFHVSRLPSPEFCTEFSFPVSLCSTFSASSLNEKTPDWMLNIVIGNKLILSAQWDSSMRRSLAHWCIESAFQRADSVKRKYNNKDSPNSLMPPSCWHV